MIEGPSIRRVRHELKRRRLTVKRVEPLPAHRVRVVLGGDDLAGFTSPGFDDHVKLFFPDDSHGSNEAAGETWRDFTPRRFDADARELWIDSFAAQRRSWHCLGRRCERRAGAGSRRSQGSAIIEPVGIDTHLLIGDETALPAIGRRLEELPSTASAVVVAEIEAAARPGLNSSATVQAAWTVRDRESESAASASHPPPR